MHEAIFQQHGYLGLRSGFLLCSLRPFRMLTSVWAHLPVLGDYSTRDIIASLVARPPCYQSIADSRRAKKTITQERDFLPELKHWVSIPEIR